MKNKTISIFSTILLVLIMTLSASILGFLSGGFRDWNIQDWFKSKDKDEKTIVGVDEDGQHLISGNIYDMKSQMTLLSASFEDVALRATIRPDTALNKKVDWVLSWVDGSSSWANGKNVADYVTVTPQADGSNIAALSCIEAFGEQIKVVVSSRENTDIKAECTVDFLSRVESFAIETDGDVSIPSVGGVVNVTSFFRFTVIDYLPIFSVGTINDNYELYYEILAPLSSQYEIYPYLGIIGDSAVGMEFNVSIEAFDLDSADQSVVEDFKIAIDKANLPFLQIKFTLEGELTGSKIISYTFRSVAGSFGWAVNEIELETGNIII